jgi:hypothetical protein
MFTVGAVAATAWGRRKIKTVRVYFFPNVNEILKQADGERAVII